MPGRSSNTGTPNDLNKFTGVERDTEGDINLDAFGRRLYDPEIGRFYGADRFHHKYPSLSPFSYVANIPTSYTDANGDTIRVDNNGTSLIFNNGSFYNNDGSLYEGELSEFAQAVLNDLITISESGEGDNLVSDLVAKNQTVLIKPGKKNGAFAKGKKRWIEYNHKKTEGGTNRSGSNQRAPFVGLTHELGHQYDYIVKNNVAARSIWLVIPETNEEVRLGEKEAMHWENVIRAAHGMPLREYYHVTPSGVGYGQSLFPNSNISRWNMKPVQVNSITVRMMYEY